jgi:hypothetical protein
MVRYVVERKGQAQPPEANVACNDDVRVSIIGQLPGVAAVACTVWFGDVSPRFLKHRRTRMVEGVSQPRKTTVSRASVSAYDHLK